MKSRGLKFGGTLIFDINQSRNVYESVKQKKWMKVVLHEEQNKPFWGTECYLYIGMLP